MASTKNVRAMASTKNVVVGMMSTTADSVSNTAGSLAKGTERRLDGVLGIGGTAAQETGEQVAKRADLTTLFNVKHFSGDLDGDGKVTPDEKYVMDALDGVADANGDIAPRQLYALLINFAHMRRGYRWLKWLAMLMMVSAIAQAGAMIGIVWGTGEYFLHAVPRPHTRAWPPRAPPPHVPRPIQPAFFCAVRTRRTRATAPRFSRTAAASWPPRPRMPTCRLSRRSRCPASGSPPSR